MGPIITGVAGGAGLWQVAGVDLDEVADELLQRPTRARSSVGLRTARQTRPRTGGDKALAKEMGRATQAVRGGLGGNVLVRAQRPEIEGLVELGTLLREAQENLAGDRCGPSTSSVAS